VRRRDLLILFAAAGCSVPLPSEAQQKPVIGILASGSAEGFATIVQSFREGLKRQGFAEGENLAIEYAWAEGNYDKLPELAADLVKRKVDAIVAIGGAVAALAVKRATSSIPIVFSIGDDPVKFGVVENLGRPNGNITGVTLFMGELTPKRMELLAALSPTGKLVILTNPRNPNAQAEVEAARAAAKQGARALDVINATNDAELESGIAQIGQQPGTAMILATDPFFFIQRAKIATLAVKHAVPGIYFHRGFATAGGLISYGATIHAENVAAGIYTGRILKGEKPGDLPIQQPSKIELVVNAKTARDLKIVVPSTILALADDIIE